MVESLIHFVFILGPPVLDFGKVCLRSVRTMNLSIVNNLKQHIHVVAEVCIFVLLHHLLKLHTHKIIMSII